MKIETYMRSIYQEFPDNKDFQDPDWYYKDIWTYHTNHRKNDLPEKHLKHLRLREEEFGGLIYNQFSTAVFKVDKEMFQLVHLLKTGTAIDEIGNKLNISTQEIEEAILSLKKYDCW